MTGGYLPYASLISNYMCTYIYTERKRPEKGQSEYKAREKCTYVCVRARAAGKVEEKSGKLLSSFLSFSPPNYQRKKKRKENYKQAKKFCKNHHSENVKKKKKKREADEKGIAWDSVVHATLMRR